MCSWRSIYRPRHRMGDCPIARSASVSRQRREAHSSAPTTFGRASPSAVAEQANSALEPTALRAAAQRPSRYAEVRSPRPENAFGFSTRFGTRPVAGFECLFDAGNFTSSR